MRADNRSADKDQQLKYVLYLWRGRGQGGNAGAKEWGTVWDLQYTTALRKRGKKSPPGDKTPQII